jgi:hypothetical protein
MAAISTASTSKAHKVGRMRWRFSAVRFGYCTPSPEAVVEHLHCKLQQRSRFGHSGCEEVEESGAGPKTIAGSRGGLSQERHGFDDAAQLAAIRAAAMD